MTFTVLYLQCFLSECELAPDIVITLPFYLNRLWAPAIICRHLLNLYCMFFLSKASILLPLISPHLDLVTAHQPQHQLHIFGLPQAPILLISWKILPAIAQQPPRCCKIQCIHHMTMPSSCPSIQIWVITPTTHSSSLYSLQLPFMKYSSWPHHVTLLLYTENLVAWSPMLELLSLRWSKWLEGCWLQLMCCTLPKCLCP